MKKALFILGLFTLCIQAVATDTDTTEIFSLKGNKGAIDTTLAGTDSMAVMHVEGIDSLSSVYLSMDVLSFEDNKIPVDQDLFEYHISLMNFEVPMEYNNLVKAQIDYFGTRWQHKLKEMITKSDYFFPLYDEILAEYGMPAEIKYLSIIESGLNPFARSRTGAVGAWQFMPATARIFDLKMNSQLDERRSLEKSTRAACQYLNQMYNQYGDWLVALASYNCGPGNVRKAMRHSGKKDFWGIYKYLPRETQNYVPKFIAMTYMMNFYGEYGIVPAPIEASLYLTETVFCEEGMDLGLIAERISITKQQLMKYNPEMKAAQIPFNGKGYRLNVPLGTSDSFYAHYADIVVVSAVLAEERRIEEAKKPKVQYHYVRRGESLLLIARKHRTTVSQLKKWNGLKGTTIYPKQRLKIYKG